MTDSVCRLTAAQTRSSEGSSDRLRPRKPTGNHSDRLWPHTQGVVACVACLHVSYVYLCSVDCFNYVYNYLTACYIFYFDKLIKKSKSFRVSL